MRKSASVVVEVLAVLFVFGLVAAVAIPDFDRQKPEVQLNAMIKSLETVRTALDRYWGDHGAAYPTAEDLNGLGNPTRLFRDHTPLSAYLNGVPEKPFTHGNRVGPITDPVGSSDWVYDPATGVFKANDGQEHRAL